MWIITGPFDEDHSEGQAPDKQKLLKTAKQYSLGRRDHPLQIKSKAISKTHALFVVGSCSEQEAADPAFVPTLTFQNTTDRVRQVERPSQSRPRVLCQPKTSMDLENGDVVHLSPSIFVRVRWERLCCYNPLGKGVPQSAIRECAQLGIHLVPTPHPDVTHHLTSAYTLTPAIATSLISAVTLVKPEWLNTLLTSGRSDEPGELSLLEEHFVLPQTTKFRPSFSPSLPQQLKKYAVWEPNEERAGLFRGHRFIFVGEKGAETPNAMKELVKRGEGDYECLAAANGKDAFRQVLAKGRARNATLVPVATRDSVVAAVGRDGWSGLVQEATSFELKFVVPEKIVEAVVHADVSRVDATCNPDEVPEDSPLPDVVPNTIEDEPSIVDGNTVVPPRRVPAAREPEPEAAPSPPAATAPRRKLTRRATSRASSRAPSPPPEPPSQQAIQEEPAPMQGGMAPEAEPVPQRRTLVRRARVKAALADDDSMDLDQSAGRASEEPQVEAGFKRPESVVPPTPSRPSRLKRRVGAASQLFPPSGTDDAGALIPDADMKEPPLKKFKALFDESDPDRVARMDMSEYGSQHVGSASGGESLTQYEPSVTFATQTSGSAVHGRSGRSGGSGLLPVREEEEEGTVASQTQARGTKRKTQEDDVDVDDEEHPRSKRRTGEVPAEQSQAPLGQSSAQNQNQNQNQTQAKPMSKVVTRVDMAQTQVHVKPPKPSSSKKAQQAGPDRDDAFLKAVASTKRGKKSEDTFDREFNDLRISKPDLEREREDEEWKVLEEFGDDGDVRGNFMEVFECPVFREAGANREHMRRGEGRVEWLGRPDFKKFKKAAGEGRQPIELVVEEQSDLGIGSQYWKGSQAEPPSQSQPRSQSQQPKSSTTQRSAQRNGKERASFSSDSDADEKPVVAKSTKGKSQASSVKPPTTQKSTATRTTRGKKSSQRQPLFIADSDDGDEDVDKDDDFRMGSDNDEALHDEDEDEDDEFGATLKSTGRSSRTATQASSRVKSSTGTTSTKKNAPAIVVDDDSDDGGFKAFGARSRTRKR
ncbi:hypothetical protein LXA43DRAFT_585318 [Ganoderma leucocontextum]|nr:hypothetical protein LXA43DRAFT_585318 [Ganoderma leucocontextum]